MGTCTGCKKIPASPVYGIVGQYRVQTGERCWFCGHIVEYDKPIEIKCLKCDSPLVEFDKNKDYVCLCGKYYPPNLIGE